MICNSCNNINPDGTLTCVYCGQDLSNPTVIQGVAIPVASAQVASSISSSPSSSAVAVLIPIISGVEDPTRAITLMSGYFRFLVGRTDLSQSPPVKPQIDLEKLFPDLVESVDGYIVSRLTGHLRREVVTNQVFFNVHSKCGSTVLIQCPDEQDSRQLKPGDEDVLVPGTILLIGSRNSYIEFIAR